MRFPGVRFEDVRGLCWRFKVNKPRLRRGAFSSVAQLVEAIEIWLSTGTPTQAAYLAQNGAEIMRRCAVVGRLSTISIRDAPLARRPHGN